MIWECLIWRLCEFRLPGSVSQNDKIVLDTDDFIEVPEEIAEQLDDFLLSPLKPEKPENPLC